MSIFRYDPNAIRTWSNKVARYMDEDIQNVSNRFKAQIDALVQPGVWTGDAALKNYQNFVDTHNALTNFINNFGESFQNAMNAVNQNVADLEDSNLGVNSNAKEALNLTYSNISDIEPETIKSDTITYDYGQIQSIGEELAKIKNDLTEVYANLKNAIQEINNNEGLWDGDAAERARDELTSTLTSNMDKVLQCLEVCISNIKFAGENAAAADSAA